MGMNVWNELIGPNAGYLAELYERYLDNPAAVDDATRAFFDATPPPDAAITDAGSTLAADKIVGAANLAQALRAFGHLAATLNPLREHWRGDPALELATHHLSEADLEQLPARLIGGPVAARSANAREAIRALREIYSSTTGHSYAQIHDPTERAWLRDAAETRRFRPTAENLDAVGLLKRLTQVETFEHFLHRSFPGKTRFSIEGLDMLVPMLDEIIRAAGDAGTRTIFLGMAHRGRLNVLANVLRKPLRQIFAEFQDPARGRELTPGEELGWTGDVKYHLGAHHAIGANATAPTIVIMPPNPSHLEAINPVVEGMARAEGTTVNRAGAPTFDAAAVLPLLIHGDAAFPGQGIVAETLNLSRLAGYQTGGTIHLIANNQLGYTATPKDGRSTLYASDLAKGFEIPIVHVNADDPEACIEAARLAAAYRAAFHKDFLIDLVGYRRYGHNEGDEPGFTQPQMYEKIAQHPTVLEQWANTLRARGVIDAELAPRLAKENWQALQTILEAVQPETDLAEDTPQPPPRGAARRTKTGVPLARLSALNQALLALPEGFALNPKLERAMARRRHALDDADARTIDWATAEQLALALILTEGIPIRFTGQDVERGTFGQRHAVFHDVKTGATYTPLQALPQARAAFEIHDSPLTEAATIGFEYGYNAQKPERLVLWEAQYGDFINEAQVMIDEFIVSARAKWGQTPSLVLLLPHAWEGAGPDHSSGRLERFLALAAETNLRIVYPTTAAQYFHLLRRQALLLKTDPLPLIVMTPKSLLRHAQTASSARELAEGSWQPVMDDAHAQQPPDAIQRLILCSGKVAVDLEQARARATTATAIVRIGQLYPFPTEQVSQIIQRYRQAREVVWVQEEPENMGAWQFIQPYLLELLKGRLPLHFVGRPPNSSPAEGSAARAALNQKQLVERALQAPQAQ